MQKNLVIVESPAKAKTIEKFLGKDFKVLSSYGHIRDLKKKEFSIDVDKDFKPHYEIPADKKKLVTQLKEEAEQAETVWLASDEDREGEAIAWHLMTMNNPYFEVINEEIKAVVESKGDVLETRDSGMDAKVQAKQVEKFIEEKVDCILINAVDWKKIGSSLKKAKKAGIPVIAVDTLIYNRSFVDGTVVSNNYQAGEQCAKDLMKRRKKGKILFLVQSENKSAIDRIKGCFFTNFANS